jgi:hypothetical protein
MRRIFIMAVAIIVLLLGGWVTFVLFAHYSDGERIGHLVKFSHKGVVFKTWEGQLNTGVAGSDATQPLSTAWSFSVTDDKVIEDLRNNQGKKVKFFYKEKYYVFPWQGDTRYFVTQVQVLE